MQIQHRRSWWAICSLLASLNIARAAVPSAEDLSACPLPNGRSILPVVGTSFSSNGPLLTIATGTYSNYPRPEGGRIPTPDQMLASIQSAKSADLQFLPDQGGSLWAFSGAISEVVGASYLSDLTTKKLDEPGPIPKTSKNFAGQISPIREGAVYLLKTVDGRFALLRVLEITTDFLVFQYVYQPAGGTTFIVPVNQRVPYSRPEAANPPATAPVAATLPAPDPATPPAGSSIASISPIPTGPVNTQLASAPPTSAGPDPFQPAPNRPLTTLPPVPPTELAPGDINDPTSHVIRIVGGPTPPKTSSFSGTDPALESFSQQRLALIQKRLDIISAPARTNQEIERKAQAIAELSQLHADDPALADTLVSEIAFLNTRSSVKEFSPDALHPALGALKRMGKPATAAVLRALQSMDLQGPGEGIESPLYKVGLLGMVIRGVEGNDLADYIFRHQADQQTDPKRKAVFEYLLTK